MKAIQIVAAIVLVLSLASAVYVLAFRGRE